MAVKEPATREKARSVKRSQSARKTQPVRDKNRQTRNPKKKERIYIMSRQEFGILAAILLVLYIGASIYFSRHFFFGTTINGMKCQFKTVEQVKNMMDDYVGKYELTLLQRNDKKESISGSDISLRFVDDGKIDSCKNKQKGYFWISGLWEDHTYENTSFSYKKEQVETAVAGLSCLREENITAPESAYPKFNEERKEYEIVEEIDGTTVLKDVLLDKVTEAIEAGAHTLDMDKAGCYKKPAWYKDDKEVIKAKNTMNQYVKSVITYDMDYTEEEVDANRIHEWLSMNKDCEVIIDRAKVRDFMSEMGRKYNTVGKERRFTTPSGSSITVSGGIYGWRLNQEDETDALIELIKEGKAQTREPLYLAKGLARDEDGDDLHDTYIAICIAEQTMWYYEDGQCRLTTSVVTGNTSLDRGTPKGVYSIAFKKKGHLLVGEGYESEVDYWLPFYEWRGIGIHDASWRNGEFGGNIYKTNGSHGCVNTPYYEVKRLFEMVETGTPVVVY